VCALVPLHSGCGAPASVPARPLSSVAQCVPPVEDCAYVAIAGSYRDGPGQNFCEKTTQADLRLQVRARVGSELFRVGGQVAYVSNDCGGVTCTNPPDWRCDYPGGCAQMRVQGNVSFAYGRELPVCTGWLRRICDWGPINIQLYLLGAVGAGGQFTSAQGAIPPAQQIIVSNRSSPNFGQPN